MKLNVKNLTIGVLGSHSALEVCAGAKRYGLNTLVIAQKGRDKPYSKYYKTQGSQGCVDETIVLNKFSQLLTKPVQGKLNQKNVVFIPHRSFEVYLNFDYQAIETKFKVPMFGNRKLLKIEERSIIPNQYDLLESANIRYPKIFSNPKNIDRLCLVKVLEKARGFERAFYLVSSYRDYLDQTEKNLRSGRFSKNQLKDAVIEEFITGVHVNFNFFYSPLENRLELLGTDTRRQTNLEGIMRIPAALQQQFLKKQPIKYEEAGHIAVTVLESMLEQAFALGERFIKAAKKFVPPGVIGPFALQSIITPGPPKKDIVVVDVSPRVPGSPGFAFTPYSVYIFVKSFMVGERIAMEIKNAAASNQLNKILT